MLPDRGDPLSKQIIVPDEVTHTTTRRLIQGSGRSAKIMQGIAGHAWLIAHRCTLTTTARVKNRHPPLIDAAHRTGGPAAEPPEHQPCHC